MKKAEKFNRIGVTERQANQQLAWTLAWAFLTLAVSLIFIFQP